jgi:cytochrome P450
MSILNVLWLILAGERYEQDDPRLWSVFHQNKKFSEALGRNFAVFFMPKLAKMFPDFTGWNELTKLADGMKAITMGHVERHRKTFPEGGVPRDFIDAYLKEIDATTDPQSSFYKENGLRSLSAVVGELFLMGFDTVTMQLSWAILYLVTFPEVQKKVQEELDAVVGRDRATSLADRPLLPYVEATIAETLRYSSVVSFGPFHAAAQDTKILGYDVPKGTLITSTPYRLHFDEKTLP